MNPYALEWKKDHDYLIEFFHKHQGMVHFRVDCLSGIEILPSAFLLQTVLDAADYINKIIDMFAAMGMKSVLSGSDSLDFRLAMDQELYDWAKPIHTTFIPYREYSRLLGIDSISAMEGHCGSVSLPLIKYRMCLALLCLKMQAEPDISKQKMLRHQ